MKGIEFLPSFLGVSSIGTYEFLEAYVKAGILNLRPNKKMILLVDPKEKIRNQCYFDYWKKYISVVMLPRLPHRISRLRKHFEVPFNKYMILNGKKIESSLALGTVREQWVQEGREPILELTPEHCDRGWESLSSFGMNKTDWFTSLHVRDNGFYKRGAVDAFRNADIDTYKLAIEAVTDDGGWLIRIGDSSMKPLPKMRHVIDYALSKEKSDWMDVFLCAQCLFFIGTSSGMYPIAMAFGRPVVATNFLPTCCAYYLTSQDLFIPKILKFKESK